MIEMHAIVKRLIGPVVPVGTHEVDLERHGNLKELILLTNKLLGQISGVAECADAHEASVRAMGIDAKKFLEQVRDELG